MIHLGWLLGKKGNIESLPDRVWMSEQAKYAGIAREAALRMAQKKIEADSTNDLPAESAEEWLRINRPE
jgi:hypothetical protein